MNIEICKYKLCEVTKSTWESDRACTSHETYRRADCAFKLVRIGSTIFIDIIVRARVEIPRGAVVTFCSFYRNARVVSTGALDTEIKNSRRSVPAEFALNTLCFIEGILASCARPALVRSCRCC
jgi:hypothetical protein